MTEVLSLIFSGELSCEEVLLWVSNSRLEVGPDTSLGKLTCHRTEFIAEFLNFLRKECRWLLERRLSTTVDSSSRRADVQLDQRSSSPQSSETKSLQQDSVVKTSVGVSQPLEEIHFRHARKPRVAQPFHLGQFLNTDHASRAPSNKNPHMSGPNQYVQRMIPKENYNSVNIFDHEAFPEIGAPPSISKQCMRRIKPTPLLSSVPAVSSNPAIIGTLPDASVHTQHVAFSGTSTEDRPWSLDDDREMLRNEKAAKQLVHNFQQVPLVSGKSVADGSSKSIPAAFLSPLVEEVSCKEQIAAIIDIYAAIINENLVPNVTTELYFLFKLLTAQEEINDERKKFLTCEALATIHNCVYLACHTLNKVKLFLRYLDKATVGLLVENPRLLQFCPELCEFLSIVYHHTISVAHSIFVHLPGVVGVAYQPDTDSRDNFPDLDEFNRYKKQRDCFYNILHEWESKRLTRDWCMRTSQERSIKSLVNMGNSPVVYVHLCRLFQSQLIAMCAGDSLVLNASIAPGPDVVSDLQKNNPDKFLRLQKRFLVPPSSKGPCPLPSFPDFQEFFRDFIVIASSYAFNVHLINSFTTKILELNAYIPDGLDYEMNGTIEEDTRRHFLSCLQTTRLLAKFLGFVFFMPYKCNGHFSKEVLESQVAVRQSSAPPFDAQYILVSAVQAQRTILTVPWMVEFLAMMDECAPYLPCFRRVLLSLWYLSRTFQRKVKGANKSYDWWLQQVMLGWLFEVLKLPPTLFIEIQEEPNCLERKDGDLCLISQLDRLNLIDNAVLYTCCPYLRELRVLLEEFMDGVCNSVTTIRKITPVAAALEPEVDSLAMAKQLMIKLEENFFHNHSPSVKKIVEFVADRVTSNLIREIYRPFILKCRLEFVVEAKKCVLDERAVYAENHKEVPQKVISTITHTLAEKYWKETIDTLGVKLHSELRNKCLNAVTMLMSSQVNHHVVSVCGEIANRIVIKKASQWLSSHVTLSYFKEEIHSLSEKKLHSSTILSESSSDHLVKHDVEVPPISNILTRMKVILLELLPFCEVGSTFSTNTDAIKIVLHDLEMAALRRADIWLGTMHMCIQLSVDLALTLVLQYPNTWDQFVLFQFIELWKVVIHGDTPPPHIITPTTVVRMHKSPCPQLSLAILERLTSELITTGILHLSQFEQQCILVLEHPCPDIPLNWFMPFVHRIMKNLVQTISDAHLKECLFRLSVLNTQSIQTDQ